MALNTKLGFLLVMVALYGTLMFVSGLYDAKAAALLICLPLLAGIAIGAVGVAFDEEKS